jgi:regulatory protein
LKRRLKSLSEAQAGIRHKALTLLAGREHSEQELQQKLTARGYPGADVARILEALQQEGLQSNQRYTAAYIHNRIDRGYGPARIVRELQQKGITEEMITTAMEDSDVDWQRQIAAVRRKKFGDSVPTDFQARVRQARFLQYRGFTGDQIRQLFRQTQTTDD